MTAVLPALGLLLATALVKPGDSLATVATRELGDGEAASELAAVNGLSPEPVLTPGSQLLLPGPERREALDRIHAVSASMRDANSEEGRKSAQAELDRAYQALRAARYAEAASLADSASQVLVAPVTRFSVTVQPDRNRTEIEVETGSLEVTGAGHSSIALAGTAVTTRHGEAPEVRRRQLPSPPLLLEPANGTEVSQPALRWQPIPGVAYYKVVVAHDTRFHDCAFHAEVKTPVAVPTLPDGSWFWRVLSVDSAGEEGVATVARSFTVRRRSPVVNVGQPIFKEGR